MVQDSGRSGQPGHRAPGARVAPEEGGMSDPISKRRQTPGTGYNGRLPSLRPRCGAGALRAILTGPLLDLRLQLPIVARGTQILAVDPAAPTTGRDQHPAPLGSAHGNLGPSLQPE